MPLGRGDACAACKRPARAPFARPQASLEPWRHFRIGPGGDSAFVQPGQGARAATARGGRHSAASEPPKGNGSFCLGLAKNTGARRAGPGFMPVRR